MYVLHPQPNIPDSLPHKRGGHCSKCQRFVRESRKDAFKRHFIGCKGPQPPPSGDSFVPDDRTCDICGKTFTRKEKYLKHLCKRHPASPTASKYVLCDRNGPLRRVLDDLDPLQLYSLCFHQRLCIPNLWPPIVPDRGGIRGMDYELFGNPHGIQQIGDL